MTRAMPVDSGLGKRPHDRCGSLRGEFFRYQMTNQMGSGCDQLLLTRTTPDIAITPRFINLKKQIRNGAQGRAQFITQVPQLLLLLLLRGDICRNTEQAGYFSG